jgi:hypothetical protein
LRRSRTELGSLMQQANRADVSETRPDASDFNPAFDRAALKNLRLRKPSYRLIDSPISTDRYIVLTNRSAYERAALERGHTALGSTFGGMLCRTSRKLLSARLSRRLRAPNSPARGRTHSSRPLHELEERLHPGWRKRHDGAKTGARNRRFRARLGGHRSPLQWDKRLLGPNHGRNRHLLHLQPIVSRTRRICGPHQSQFWPLRDGCHLFDRREIARGGSGGRGNAARSKSASILAQIVAHPPTACDW